MKLTLGASAKNPRQYPADDASDDLFHSSPAAQIVFADGLVLRANPAAASVLGADPALTDALAGLALRHRAVAGCQPSPAAAPDGAPPATGVWQLALGDGGWTTLAVQASPIRWHGCMAWLLCMQEHAGAPAAGAPHGPDDHDQHYLHIVRTAINQAGDAIIVVDPEGERYLSLNDQACRMYGLTREDMLRMGPTEVRRLGHPHDNLAGQIALVMANPGQPFTADLRVRRPDGSQTLAEATRVAVDVDGQRVIVATLRDVTAQRQAQARAELFSAVVNFSMVGTCIVDPEEMRNIEVNDAACRLLDMTREELLDLPAWGRGVDDGSDHARVQREAQQKLRLEVIARYPETIVFEDEIERRDGTRLPVERRLQAIRLDGRWLTVSYLTDISARKQAQRQVELVRAAIDKSGDGIAVISLDTGQYLEVNEQACALFGHSREDMMRLGPAEIGVRTTGHADTRVASQLFNQNAAALMSSPGHTITTDLRVRRPDGSVVLAQVTRVALRLSNEWVQVSNFRDVTERVAAEQRLARFREALDQAVEAIVVISRRTLHLVDINETACRMYAMPREQLMQLPVYRFGVTFTDAKAQGDLYDKVIANYPAPMVEDAFITQPGGRTIPVEITRRAVRVGDEWLIVASTRDMTAPLQAKRELERFRAALDKAGDAIVLIDPHTLAYIDFNETACRLFGFSREEFAALGPAGVARALGIDSGLPDEQVLRASYAQLMAAPDQPRKAQVTARLPDGTVKHLDYTRTAHDFDGQWVIVTVMRDVTSERASQQALERFRAAIDQTQEGILIVDVETLSYVDVNDTMSHLTGLPREEIMSKGPVEIMRLTTRNAAYTAADMRASYQQLIESGGTQAVRIHSHASDGRVLLLEISRTAHRLDGRWAVVAIVRDITESQKTQQRFELFRTALDRAGDAIVLVDIDRLEYIDVNATAAQLFGLPREELIALGPVGTAQRIMRVSPDHDHRGALQASVAEMQANPDGTTLVTLEMQRPDGHIWHAEVSRKLAIMDGRKVIVSTYRDITERRRAQAEIRRRVEELTRSNQELERFAYVASHDLSEPLRMVASYTQLLARRYTDRLDADGQEFMGFVIDGAQRMKQLIDDLLTYSRAGRMTRQPRSVDMNAVLAEVRANLGQLITDRQALIEAPGLPTILADGTSMVQLLQNLVANALKFCAHPPARVTIVARDEGPMWHFEVRDNGIGIEERYFERIFVIFQRLHGRDVYPGTGIGLAICRKLVEMHGGRIWVESTPGAGSTFHFTLSRTPVVVDDAAH